MNFVLGFTLNRSAAQTLFRELTGSNRFQIGLHHEDQIFIRVMSSFGGGLSLFIWSSSGEVVSTDSEPPENIVFREYRSERTRDHLSDALDVMEQVGADGFVRYEASAGIATLSVPGANDHIIYISSPER